LRAITAKVKDTITGEKMLERTSSSTSLHNIDLDDIVMEPQTAEDDEVFKKSVAKLSPDSRRKLRNRCTSESKLDAFMEETKTLHLKEQKNAAIQKKASMLSDKNIVITHF